MKYFLTALIVAGLLSSSYVLGQACTTPYDAIANEPTLSTVKAAIDKAGLKDTFDDPQYAATLLFPSNAGITTFLADAGITAQELLDFPQLDIFLGGHIVPGAALFAADLEEGVDMETLVGEDGHVEVTFKKQGSDPKYAECGGGVHMHISSHSVVDADPLVCDIAACQAVIHILDYPLLPHNDEFEEYFPNAEITHELHEDEDEDEDHDEDDHDDHDGEKTVNAASNGSEGRTVSCLAPLGVVMAAVVIMI